MTCILAVEHGGKVYMGGDSAALFGWGIERKEKVFISGDFIVGYSGSMRFGQIIQFDAIIPDKAENQSDFGYIISAVIPAIREYSGRGGYTQTENGKERTDDMLLIGYHGRIYAIYPDFSVSCASRGFFAIGSGADFALGAFSAFGKTSRFDPGVIEEMIIESLKTSAEFSAGVLPPFYVLSK